jgi:hypothetical protein
MRHLAQCTGAWSQSGNGDAKVDWAPRERRSRGQPCTVGRPSDPSARRGKGALSQSRRDPLIGLTAARPLRHTLRPRRPHSTLIEMRVSLERPLQVRC